MQYCTENIFLLSQKDILLFLFSAQDPSPKGRFVYWHGRIVLRVCVAVLDDFPTSIY